MWVHWPAAFRSISARSLVSSLVLAAPSPSPVMSGTAFLRPVRSQLMKSEYDVSTSIICPWPALSLHLPEGGRKESGKSDWAAGVSRDVKNKSPLADPWEDAALPTAWHTGTGWRSRNKEISQCWAAEEETEDDQRRVGWKREHSRSTSTTWAADSDGRFNKDRKNEGVNHF